MMKTTTEIWALHNASPSWREDYVPDKWVNLRRLKIMIRAYDGKLTEKELERELKNNS